MSSPQGYVSPTAEGQFKLTRNRNSYVFAVCVILLEILVCLIHGLSFRLREDVMTTVPDYAGILLISILTILTIVGFGLINSYISRSSITGLGYSILSFAISIQVYYLARTFWERAGTYYYRPHFDNSVYRNVFLSNYENDRQLSGDVPSASFAEGISCALAIVISLGPLIGRIQLFEVFLVSLWGSVIYELNAQFIWRWYIPDSAFGMRTILFGGVFGLVAGVLLGHKDKTINHPMYKSDYREMSMAILGVLFVIVCYPFMATLTIFTGTTNDAPVYYAVTLNMFIAMFSGVLGTFVASSIIFRKFSVNDLVFTGTAGGFAYASSADLNFNPGAPLTACFVVGFLCTLLNNVINKSINKKGVTLSLPHIQRFVIPGLFSGIISAILAAVNDSANGDYMSNIHPGRTAIGQGAEQLLGIVITVGLAALAGIIVGVMIKLVNKSTHREEYFSDFSVFKAPEPLRLTKIA